MTIMNSHVGKLQQVVQRFKLCNVTSSPTRTTEYARNETRSSASNTKPTVPGIMKPSGKNVARNSKSPDETWGGGTATAVLPQEGESDYNIKLDDSEFGRF